MIYINEKSESLKGNLEGFTKTVKALEGHDLSFVKNRLVEQHGWLEESTEQGRLNFVRFASLTFVSNEKLVPSVEVDEFWHSFLLFTQDYKNWCELHWNPSFFFHHAPGQRDGSSWQNTCNLIKDIFNEDWKELSQEPSKCW